jgi:hypothetical protein
MDAEDYRLQERSSDELRKFGLEIYNKFLKSQADFEIEINPYAYHSHTAMPRCHPYRC